MIIKKKESLNFQIIFIKTIYKIKYLEFFYVDYLNNKIKIFKIIKKRKVKN